MDVELHKGIASNMNSLQGVPIVGYHNRFVWTAFERRVRLVVFIIDNWNHSKTKTSILCLTLHGRGGNLLKRSHPNPVPSSAHNALAKFRRAPLKN